LAIVAVKHVFSEVIVAPVINQLLQRGFRIIVSANKIVQRASEAAQIETRIGIDSRLLVVKVGFAIILCRCIPRSRKTVAAKQLVVELVDGSSEVDQLVDAAMCRDFVENTLQFVVQKLDVCLYIHDIVGMQVIVSEVEQLLIGGQNKDDLHKGIHELFVVEFATH
jgi:hypothetical protein